jgi:hypothetical protein
MRCLLAAHRREMYLIESTPLRHFSSMFNIIHTLLVADNVRLSLGLS